MKVEIESETILPRLEGILSSAMTPFTAEIQDSGEFMLTAEVVDDSEVKRLVSLVKGLMPAGKLILRITSGNHKRFLGKKSQVRVEYEDKSLKVLHGLRERFGLRLGQFASKMGVSASNCSQLFKGHRTFTLHYFNKIVRGLKLAADDPAIKELRELMELARHLPPKQLI